jgi:glucoamylase
VLESGARSAKELDISTIMGAIHTGLTGRKHSPHDPRILATLAKLEDVFADYPINVGRDPARGPAMGRYAADVYYSGGAYYFSTLAAAELCFRASVASRHRADLAARGDAFLETVRAHTPPDGCLSEQFCQKTGMQTSAKHLAWSYAALISCRAARRHALG